MQNGVDAQQEYVQLAGADLPLEPETLFPALGGIFGRRAAKRRAKALAPLAATLRRVLEPEERVRWVARGYQYSALEYYAGGALSAQWAGQTTLVLTDRRLLLLQVNRKGAPRDVKNQLRLGAICEVKRSFGRLKLVLADRQKLIFMGIPRADALGLQKLAAPAAPATTPAAGPALEHLCPACLRVVPGQAGTVAACPELTCRVPFRDERRAVRLSLLMPGLGEIYLRNAAFGLLELLKSTLLLMVGVSLLVRGLVEGDQGERVVGIVAGGILIGLPRILGYFVTRAMARRGLVPLSDRPAPGGNRSLPALPGWAYALVVGATLATLALIVPVARMARGEAELHRAEKVAETGWYQGAWDIWDAAQPKAEVTDDDRAAFALALLRGGDFRGATQLVASIGEASVEKGKAQTLSVELKRYTAAFEDYNAAREALLQGKEAEAWPRAEKAMEVLRNLRRPPGPGTRAELLVELAGDMLAPGFDGQQVLVAQRFLDEAGMEIPRARSWLVSARILAFRGEKEAALSKLDGVDGLSHPERHRLHESWQLLALEARAALTHDPIDYREIAGRAATIPERWLRKDQAERRAALVALGKK